MTTLHLTGTATATVRDPTPAERVLQEEVARLRGALAAERERQADKVRAHIGRTVMSVYGTIAECKAARDALQRLLDDAP